MTWIRQPHFFYGYIIVLAVLSIMTVFGGTMYSFGVFFKPLLNEFGWTRAITSAAFSLQMGIHGSFYIVTGRLTDKFGPRLVMTACGLLLGLGYLIMSQVSAIWQFYLFYGVMVGIGMSGGWVPLLSIVARWFVKNRGIMTGIAASGVGLGTLIMSPLAGWLISTYGWRNSYMVIGIVVLVITIVAAQFLRRDPIQKGLLPYGGSEKLDLQTRGLSLQQAIRTRQFWTLGVVLFGSGICLQTIMVHIVLHAIELGVSVTGAVNILAIIGGVSIVGRPILGSIGDRNSNRQALMISLMLMSAVLLWLLTARELWMLYLFAAAFGIAYSGIVALQSPMIAELFGLRSHGVIFGFLAFSITAGGVLGPILAGHMFDVTGSYQLAIITCIVVSFVVWMIALSLKVPAHKASL